MASPVTDNIVKTERHTTFYLACGAEDAPLIIFVHGWPELSASWRHQLPCFAGLGFRAIAPDMRGYGRSSVYERHEDYALEHSVDDMLELLRALGRDKAVWVGHDWGSPVVWSMASHHPDKCLASPTFACPTLRKASPPRVCFRSSIGRRIRTHSFRRDSGSISCSTRRISTRRARRSRRISAIP